jgi:glycosyltransferase involved in cell wall biosynthesis
MVEIDQDSSDVEVTLLIPSNDVFNPIISILVPAVNESLTISEFVSWCHTGIERTGLPGEVIIVDSSSDDTARLALDAGARVVQTPKRGLGRAYIDAIPFVRGQYVVLGDADLTYDFRDLDTFIEKLEDGYDFAMGSRWLGSIEKGAMPPLHQYFGTPITTWILNQVYKSQFTDIHCGMRAIRTERLRDMGLTSQSWEYASEMVLKSVRMNLLTTEVPVNFYKDRDGRVSHHKRSGWLSPFKAAWINLREMFIYGADFFMIKPGILLFVTGLLLSLPLSFGSLRIGKIDFGLYWMLIGVTIAVLGLQSFFFGCIAQILADYSNSKYQLWTKRFPYNRSILASGCIGLAGLVLEVNLLVVYLKNGLKLSGAASTSEHLAVLGVLLLMVGFTFFCFTLVLYATGVKYGKGSWR